MKYQISKIQIAYLISGIFLLYTVYILLFSGCSAPLKTWDYLLFTQQWPLTSCIDHKAKKHGASCNLYFNMTSWGIHGLWPTKGDSHGPNFCNKSWVFDLEKVKDIEPYLVKYWPNIFKEESISSLWEHEWSKHGTCAAELQQLNSEHKYFQKGLDLAMKFNLISILAGRKIYPSDKDPYTLQEIFQSVQLFTKGNPIIDCIYDKKNEKHELSQIKICVNRQFEVINCDDQKKGASNGNCPSTGIFYPSSVRVDNTTYSYSKELAILQSKLKFNNSSRGKSQFSKFIQIITGLSVNPFNAWKNNDEDLGQTE